MKVTYLGVCKGSKFREVADRVDSGEVSHAVLVYREPNGDITYRIVGDDHLTYIIGLLQRVIIDLHVDSTETI